MNRLTTASSATGGTFPALWLFRHVSERTAAPDEQARGVPKEPRLLSRLAARQGDQLDKGLKLFMKLNGDKLPPGVKVELIVRDDTGPNPDNAKRVAQELIVRDKVQFITGVIWTPNARAIAPLTAEAKVPFISANAAGVDVPYMSPYFARVSFTLWQSSYPLGQWAAKKYKRVYTAVSDFAPGHEAEEAFIKGFKD